MVKCSFFLSVAVCVVMASSTLVEAVDNGSASNDSSASVAGNVTTDSSASAPDAIADVTTDSSSSTTTDVAEGSTDTSSSTTTDDGSTDTSSSAATEGSTDSSASTTTDVAEGSTDYSSSTTTDVDVGSTDTSSSAATEGSTDSSSSTTTGSTDSNSSAASDVAVPTTTMASTPTPTAASSPNSTVHAAVAATTKPATTVKPGPILIGGQATLVPGYAHCGGRGFDYAVYMPEETSTSDYTRLTCEEGYRCQDVQDSDIFKCKVWPSIDPVSFYGQCGGGNYDGQTFCAPGAVCKYISASFSQCLPTY